MAGSLIRHQSVQLYSVLSVYIPSYYRVTFPEDPLGKADSNMPQHAIRIIILHDLQTSFHSEVYAFGLLETKWDYVVKLYTNQLRLSRWFLVDSDDFALGALHRVDLCSLVDVSEVQAASIFRV